ncbi:MAG: helix-turn-helix transcriptional regulator [Leucobacter sp.]|nr:helix-turn-helix transcriptional regulator [Leucobacter sp.]
MTRSPAGGENATKQLGITAPPNAVGHAFGLFGDEWTLLIMRLALTGTSKYSDFREQLPISHAVLSSRLERLVGAGLFVRTLYQQRPPRYEYLFTRKGGAVWPLLVSIWNWERRWAPTHQDSTPPLRHLTCGNEMSPIYSCVHCHGAVVVDNVEVSWGPAGSWSRIVSDSNTRRRSNQRSRTGAFNFYPGAMSVFGNRWSTVIVAAALFGVRRFSDFERVLGPPPLVLAERLAELCRFDVLDQVQLATHSNWSEYRLTDRGRDFFASLSIVVDWAETFYPDEEGAVLIRTHVPCGRPLQGVLICDHCDEIVHGSAIDISEAQMCFR